MKFDKNSGSERLTSNIARLSYIKVTVMSEGRLSPYDVLSVQFLICFQEREGCTPLPARSETSCKACDKDEFRKRLRNYELLLTQRSRSYPAKKPNYADVEMENA